MSFRSWSSRLNVFRVVKDTIGSIAESEKEVEFAAREMEYIIRKEKRAIEEFERKNSRNGGIGTIRGWLTLKRQSDKNKQTALDDMKRAMEAVKVAEEKVVAIGDRLEEEERKLQVLDIPFKIFSHNIIRTEPRF